MRNKALHILSILFLTVGMVTTASAQSKIKIHGNVYGGGDQAAVQGNTTIKINKGQYGGEIFGGGKGALNGDGSVNKSADIGSKYDGTDGVHAEGTLVEGTGSTKVTINGGKFIVEQLAGDPATVKESGKLTNNHNVFGGGNLACNVFGNTTVNINAGLLPTEFFKVEGTGPTATSMYRKWGEYVGRIEGMTTAKVPDTPEKLVQGSVFGAGYGVHTDVAGTTNVTIAIGKEEAINDPADILTRYAYAKRGGDITGEHLASKFVITAFGGGYDGTAENTNVQISGSPFLQNVFGGGLGSKVGAEQKNPGTAYASTVGTVKGGTNVNISGATIYGHVYGGGAGIFGEIEATTDHGTAKMPYYKAAMVMKETNLEISGGTLVFGNVYGGGDIANTGWFEENYRPSTAHQAYENESKAKFDLTTFLQMKGGNVMGNVFAGGNGRKTTELEKANFIGAIIGNTSVVLGNYNSSTDAWDGGTRIWGSVYGGGQNGCVYSCAAMAANNGGVARKLVEGLIDGCTNVEFKHTDIGQDIFGGGLGAVEMVDHDHTPDTPEQEVLTSADISGNTFVFFNRGNLITGSYWDPQDCVFKEQKCGEYVEDEVKVNYRDTDSDIAHNLYGGGNMACTIGTKERLTGNLVEGTGNTTIYMIGAPVVDPSFMSSKYYTDAMAIYGKPHFSAFGAGYGKYAKVLGNAYSDIALVAAGFHSVVGGGMNGPVEGECYTHIACDKDNTRIHNVYGGGYYAPVGGTHLQITEGHILENVFGGGVMGNIAPDNAEMTKAVASTVIGLKKEGDGSSYTLYGVDGTSDIRTYNYDGNKIIIDGNVYGGNDVSGTVNGVASLTLYGGTVKSNVHGAGNGNHVGYYVPDILKYDKGEHGSDNYFIVNHKDTETGAVLVTGKTYVGRPQTIGGVNLTLSGNTSDERVKVLGQVFGGGNSCTIGAWDKTMLAPEGKYHGDPHLTRDDPEYFKGGGTLNINLGSHVTIGRTHQQLAEDADGSVYIDNGENVSGLFIGCSGRDLATQTGKYKEDNYYHHFFDYKAKQYYPGFAVGNEVGGDMTREQQLKPFQAYLNNIMVWSDEVHLNYIKNQDGTDANDIWLANFVGGGFRGSMRAKTLEDGRFNYTLPEGVTVSHTIVGGAYNAHIQYRVFATNDDGTFKDEDGDDKYDYLTVVPGDWTQMDPNDPTAECDYIKTLHEDENDPEKITGILRYNFNGGILSINSTGVSSSPEGRHIHQVHADPRANEAEYATSYFEPMTEGSTDPKSEDADTRAKLYSANKSKTLLHLTLRCALEPEVLPKNDGSGKNYAHGGNVFGGCFMSGFVEGDSWVDYHCWLAPKCANSTEEKYKYFFSKTDNMHIYDDAGDLETNNALSVYGAGYGTDTHSDGDVYLYIKSIALNALGDADPAGMFPYIFNAFGGSNMGTVGGNTNVYYAVGKQGTLLGSLYGGGYKGVIEGNTFVELAEGFAHNVYGGSRQADIKGAAHVWAYDGNARGITDANHLIICNLYGGNDVAGTIRGTMPATFTSSKWDASPTGDGTPRESLTDKKFNTYVEISADDDSADRGFPLIGSAFAGGNGETWEDGDGDKPDVGTALLHIAGGSTLRAFGGGNMATITGNTYIFTDANSQEYANVTFTEHQKTIMNKVFFSGTTSGFRWTGDDEDKLTLKMDPYHVVRLFGGNNLADMSIQPTWNLKEGRIENVYSGGNMGRMTYYKTDGEPAKAASDTDPSEPNWNLTPRGLSITVDQPDIYIGSLFGGCRMADVCPGDFKKDSNGDVVMDSNGNPKLEKQTQFDESEDYYGATVNISDGYIENVYGGNDVSGTVYFGTNVNISGAVSGNVYGSGNGFYQYQWDKDFGWADKNANPNNAEVIEAIKDDVVYYKVKPRDGGFGGTGATATQRLLTINHYRPSVEKAFLNIAGLKERAQVGTQGDAGYKPAVNRRVAYVKGNVYCGGNASTVLEEAVNDNSFTKFKIGSYVTLNGVFMGSDGYAFSQADQIQQFEKLNDLDMTEATNWTDVTTDIVPTNWQQYYPKLLNLYMKAVEMKAQPKDFNLNLPLREAYIGTYCGGGNRGSMLVEKKVDLDFHHDIVIYDKIVGACLDANVVYKDVTAYGGYTRSLSSDTQVNPANNYTKLKMNVASQFAPFVMDVPNDKDPETKNSHGENFSLAVQHGFLYPNNALEVNYTSTSPYGNGCNIYGGCYQSGEVMGDIELNVYSNMLRYTNDAKLKLSIEQDVPCFNVYGAGFGVNSHVWGDVRISMDRKPAGTTTEPDPLMGTADITLNNQLKAILGDESEWGVYNGTIGDIERKDYPSTNNIFGGGRNGQLIGNTKIDLKNGFVYTDVVAGCYAADMYGSGQIVVGYPKYYECLKSAEYTLTRPDKWNTNKFIDEDHKKPVLINKVRYLKGEWVPENVYKEITAVAETTITDSEKSSTYFHLQNPTNSTWDDTDIHIGGGIYGGGYALTNSITAMAGSFTTWKLKNENTILEGTNNKYNFDGRKKLEDNLKTEGFGGNVSIMVGDRIANGTDTGNNTDKDHIHISTLKAKKVRYSEDDCKDGSDVSVIGKFIKETIDGKDYYTHQGDGLPQSGKTYYELSGTGGIYGDGHYVFCEGFRAADLTGYGYAEGTVKHPVLLNTFQRLDMLSVNDCCLMLQGAQDFATDLSDATVYSMTRIGELNLTSSLTQTDNLTPLSYAVDVTDSKGEHHSGEDADGFTAKRVRNYLGFFNNIHYLGSITSNDPFLTGDNGAKFHTGAGDNDNSYSYYDKKQNFITTYTNSDKKTEALETFKQRNVGTARNCIGINNGYCLRIQNQHYVNTDELKGLTTYYGPIIGVVEVKLLTLVEGEGGGYVYADNVHYGKNGDDGDTGTDHTANGQGFLNVSGNFVFPGIVKTGTGSQYIVDDCYPKHYGTNDNKVTPDNGTDAEAHYWYVEGNKYFFHTTLTGYTFSNTHNPFEVIKNDPNIMLAGLENGMNLNVASVKWTSRYNVDDYQSDLQIPASCPNTDGCKAEDEKDELYHTYGDMVDGVSAGTLPYEFHIEVGSPTAWKDNEGKAFVMDRKTNTVPKGIVQYNNENNGGMPIFNVKLFDNVNNAPKGHISEYYQEHLSQPEEVKIVMEARLDGTKDTDPADYTYTITMRIVYLQGPSFTGGPKINNCALPGEKIQVTSEGITIETTEQLPVTAYGWKLLQPRGKDAEGNDTWQETEDPNHSDTNPIKLDKEYLEVMPDGNLKADFPAYYYQNGWNIAYTFTAGGTEFVVPPIQETSDPTKQPKDYEKKFLIHNYHRMKEAFKRELNVEHTGAKGARIYIEDEADMTEFINILNGKDAVGTEGEEGYKPAVAPYGFKGRNVYLMQDMDISNTSVFANFEGTFDGFGHTLTIKNGETVTQDGTYKEDYTLLENYNASIKRLFPKIDDTDAPAMVVNLLVLDGSPDESSREYKTGSFAYNLNKFYLDKRKEMFDTDNSYSREFDYVEKYYENGDYQYAGVATDQSSDTYYLRTQLEPHYGSIESYHNNEHPHDYRRWNKTDEKNYPLYEVDYGKKTASVFNASKAGDFNDYIYFGQQIAKGTNGSYSYDDERPYAIKHNEPLATYNMNTTYISLGNMDNRVFRAEGFYHTKNDEGFYHNVDAVVIDPYTTAVAFGDESMSIDQPEKGITSFNVDSNLDYAVTDDDYDNSTTGHVTQNLLVYAMKSDAQDKDARSYMSAGIYGNGKAQTTDKSREQDIRYHTIYPIEPEPLSGALFNIANLHLVDKQDFNAPYKFDVTSRAWYERMPPYYRNVTVTNGDNVTNIYNDPSAWEGIVLPFTVKKVTASENGEISHFYGDNETEGGVNVSTLHHEYWLNGLVEVTDAGEGTKNAIMARPSKTGEGLFTDATLNRQEVATGPEYTYPANTYFTELTNYTDYHDNDYEDGDTDGDSWARTDPEWYLTGHKFENYVYLSKSVPYIIAFPGNDFYEFSLEGQIYNRDTHRKALVDKDGNSLAQRITFEASNAAISVSDDETGDRISTANGYYHVGTYLRKSSATYMAMNDKGSAFVAPTSGQENTILPFRTYMTTSTSAPPAPAPRRIIINGAEDEGEKEIEIDLEDDEDNAIPALSIRIKGLRVIVTSTFDDVRRVNVYSVKGQLLRVHDAPTGVSEFRLPTPGLYIINGVKVTVR